MLGRLTIDNYALIDHLDISFPGDLVIITGETGAGKSILLGALSLVLGARSDVSAIKNKERNCVVEAEFADEQGETIIRRVLTPQGRSRSFINDEPATVDQLREAASRLVDIHSQNQHLLLADRKFQLSVLDSYAGLSEDLEAYEGLYGSLQSALADLAGLKEKIAAAEKNREYLEFQYNQLDRASLREGEYESLVEEQKLLSNSETIKTNIAAALNVFEGRDISLDAGLKEAENALSKVAPFIPGFDDLRNRLESARIEIKDIQEEIESKEDVISFSPERLEEVYYRVAMLDDLMRKFSVKTVEELIAIRDDFADQLGVGVDNELELGALKKRCAALRSECEAAADTIHSRRCEAAPLLSALLQEQVRSLEMPRAIFEVVVNSRPDMGPDGRDDVEFDFNANGGPLKELSKCASGGELSRIMLCLKLLLARYKGMPTMVFDEIDTGVSGSIADKMGRMIVEMGSLMQVFAITHLPQVASKGSAHYLVYKENGVWGAETKIRKIKGDERVMELARMLSGSGITPEAVANAKVLLQEK